METIISLCIGLALSAASGFRLLIPFLALSVAAIFGHFPISPDLEWVGTYPALEAFAIAVLAETLMYYVPWLDHLMDVIALPASMVAGTLITASFTTHLDPFLQWSLAVVAGGGTAAAIKGLTGTSRLTSTLTTGGFGNFIVTTLELLGAVILSLMAIVLPKLALILVPLIGALVIWQGFRFWKKRQSLQPSTE
jgi:hypothetical protein